MSVQELTTDNFNEAISSDKAVLVDFFAKHCGPCKMQMPILHRVADEYADKMGFASVDTDEISDEILAKYQIQSVPTLMVFKNGEVLKKDVGMKQEPQLKEWIKEYL